MPYQEHYTVMPAHRIHGDILACKARCSYMTSQWTHSLTEVFQGTRPIMDGSYAGSNLGPGGDTDRNFLPHFTEPYLFQSSLVDCCTTFAGLLTDDDATHVCFDYARSERVHDGYDDVLVGYPRFHVVKEVVNVLDTSFTWLN